MKNRSWLCSFTDVCAVATLILVTQLLSLPIVHGEEETSTAITELNGNTTTTPVPQYSCFFCRSDDNRACLNDFGFDLSRTCNIEMLKVLRESLEAHPIDSGIWDPNGRSASSSLNWACYTVITTDRNFVLRTCTILADPLEKHDNECHPCKTKAGDTAKCCVCSKTNCNNERSQASRFLLGVGHFIYLGILIII